MQSKDIKGSTSRGSVQAVLKQTLTGNFTEKSLQAIAASLKQTPKRRHSRKEAFKPLHRR